MSIADKLVLIAENEQKVYKAGKNFEYDNFWDNYQNYGNRKAYLRAFDGDGFNIKNLLPKYDIKPVGDASYIFYGFGYCEKDTIDLSQLLKNCGVLLDTSKATKLNNAFAGSRIKKIPPIDCTGISGTVGYVFMETRDVLETIEKVVVSDKITNYLDWFYNTTGLKNITFEGEIAGTGLDFSSCTILTAESIESIINALSNNTSGIVLTLSLQSVNKAFETEEGLMNGNTSAKWTSLVDSKKNWTISLI